MFIFFLSISFCKDGKKKKKWIFIYLLFISIENWETFKIEFFFSFFCKTKIELRKWTFVFSSWKFSFTPTIDKKKNRNDIHFKWLPFVEKTPHQNEISNDEWNVYLLNSNWNRKWKKGLRESVFVFFSFFLSVDLVVVDVHRSVVGNVFPLSICIYIYLRNEEGTGVV